MNTYAYDHGLPCLNPSCKSHGKSHPNCMCYGPGMAEGGEVEHYCSKDRPHKSDCMYYSGGQAEAYPFAEGGEAPDFIPDSEIPQQKDEAPDFISDNEMQSSPQHDTGKYGSLPQQALTGVEGLGQGFLGPLATGAEKLLNKAGVPGLSDEEIAGRAEENPLIHGGAEVAGLGAGLLTGTGEAGLISRGVGKLIPEGASALAKIGSLAIKGGIESGLFQTGDEISNAMLGKGDPEAPVSSALAHIGGATLLGSATGGLFGSIGQGGAKALANIESSKMAGKANNIMLGLGLASRMKELGLEGAEADKYLQDAMEGTGIKASEVKLGIKAFNSGVEAAHSKITRGAADALGSVAGGAIGGLPGSVAGGVFTDQVVVPLVESIIDKGITKANKYVMPAVTKAISEGNTDGLFKAITYAEQVTKGAAKINSALDGLFKVGGQQILNYENQERDREKLKKFVEDGGMNQQIINEKNASEAPDFIPDKEMPKYAKGGQVKPQKPLKPDVLHEQDHLANIFPEQSMLLGSAKARVYNYLNGIRPQPPVGQLPYDKYEPNKESEKSYKRALDIANQPLSVMKHIKDGTITTEHIKHVSQMYPELYKHLSQKITSRIAENQLHDERPSYKVRQGLSLFLANPLESSFTPFNIQQAQYTFMPKQAPGQMAQGKTKRGTSTLGKDNKTYRTANQAAESDRSSRD